MQKLNIKMPRPISNDYNLELEEGNYIVKDTRGNLYIDTWLDNTMGFYCWELDALSEIVCKLPDCETLMKILEEYEILENISKRYKATDVNVKSRKLKANYEVEYIDKN